MDLMLLWRTAKSTVFQIHENTVRVLTDVFSIPDMSYTNNECENFGMRICIVNKIIQSIVREHWIIGWNCN